MADKPKTVKQLFKDWRGGDAESGQLMAQRFADWYYAIATSRLGEDGGREPCETACGRFGEGIVNVTESRALVKWAHEIIVDELGDNARATDGDEANAYTGNQKPKTLLAKAKAALPTEVGILELVYQGGASQEDIDKASESLGGYPLGVLKARYKVKQWLRDHQRVPFEVAPDNPVLDRAPLPLYESDQMKTPAEEASFEQWMLTDIDLCKDIAEFAVFSIALRGGIPDHVEEPKPQAAQNKSSDGEGSSGGGGGGGAAVAAAGGGLLLVGGGIVLLVVIVAGIGIAMSMM